MILNKNKNFCIMPWVQLYKDPDGETSICCMSQIKPKSSSFSNNIKEVLNDNSHKSIRKLMLQNKFIPECYLCYEADKYGNSLRQKSNKWMLDEEYEKYILENTNSDGSLKKIILRNVDIRFSNKCNYKCRTCDRCYSTTWDREDNPGKEIKEVAFTINIKKWFNKNIKYINQIKFLYFAGGEPLIQDQHYEFLDLMISNNFDPKKIWYQSNGSVLKYKDWNIINLWKNFSNVYYSLSLDGLGSMGEYIRTGFKEKIVLKNIFEIKNSGVIKDFYINMVIQAYNVFYLIEFLDKIFEKGLLDKIDQLQFTLLITHERHQPKVLPKPLKLIAIDKIKKSKYYKIIPDKLNPIIKNLETESGPEIWEDFCNFTSDIDKKRNTSIITHFPEIAEWMN